MTRIEDLMRMDSDFWSWEYWRVIQENDSKSGFCHCWIGRSIPACYNRMPVRIKRNWFNFRRIRGMLPISIDSGCCYVYVVWIWLELMRAIRSILNQVWDRVGRRFNISFSEKEIDLWICNFSGLWLRLSYMDMEKLSVDRSSGQMLDSWRRRALSNNVIFNWIDN